MNDRLRRRLDPSLYTQHLAATKSLSVPFSSATSVQFWAAANIRSHGEERDEREGRLAGGADEGEDLVDPREQSRPLGRPGGGGIRCVKFCLLWLGRRGQWFLWKGGMWA